MISSIKEIDITFDFTTDTPNYWLGIGVDPDNASPTLQRYQKLLWSKKLPNGEIMNLSEGCGSNYLYWKNFRFGSDSIINMYTHHKNAYIQNLLQEIKKTVSNYDEFIETYIRKGYTIGGELIFPKNGACSINSRRGTDKLIKDRFDLTIECIRRFYKNEASPLTETLSKNKEFFDLFVDFKGYIDYFLLQDMVSQDYSTTNCFLDIADFARDPYPQNTIEWHELYNKQMQFLENRNRRIFEYIHEADSFIK
ncbi:MAG: hypothetical protein MSB80_00680 [Alphaproteobacteria bacterium]|nr:hypothetical protein [Alphaproteobacteria bacterium]